MPKGLVFAVGPVVLAYILLQPPDGQLPFLLGEPRRGPGEVGQDKVGAKGHPDRDYAFNDKEPFPGSESSVAVHVLLDAGGNQPGEGA